MEITPEQKVTSDNFKAHILALKAELRSVSEELDSTMRLKEASSMEVDGLSHRRDAILNEIQASQKQHADRIAVVNAMEKKLVGMILDHENNVIGFNFKKDKEIQNLKEIRKNHEQSVQSAEAEIASLQEKTRSSTAELDKALKGIDYASVQLEQLNREKTRIAAVLSSVEEDYKKMNEVHAQATTRHAVELEDLRIRLMKARADIKTPMDSVAEREAILARRERNFEIRRVRLQNQINKYFPDEQLTV